MKLKYLLAACTAFFLVSCSNDDELPQLPQHGDIVGLNIKDAKYIYTSGTNTRSSAAQYRQIKKDGRDMELSWIDDKGDTIKINGNPKIWNINATYVMVSTEKPINYNLHLTKMEICFQMKCHMEDTLILLIKQRKLYMI